MRLKPSTNTPNLLSWVDPGAPALSSTADQSRDTAAFDEIRTALTRARAGDPSALDRLPPAARDELRKLLLPNAKQSPTPANQGASPIAGALPQAPDAAPDVQQFLRLLFQLCAAYAESVRTKGYPMDWGNGAGSSYPEMPSGASVVGQQLRDGVSGEAPPPTSYNTDGITVPQGEQGRLLQAIAGQESGGNYQAVNADSGALGKYQVMPENVASWSKEALGRSISPQEFLASPQLQEQVVGHKLQQYYKEGMASTGSQEGAVRFAAAKWYSGRGEKWNDTRPQSYGGNSYPSIASYTASVWKRFQGA